jgi:lipoprotein NlpI
MAMVLGLRRSRLNLFCAVGMFFAGMLFSAPPAAADDRESCLKEFGDIKIDACSRAITSGQYSGRDLARLYFTRGVAYRIKGQHDRAIQDFDQTIRLNPQNVQTFIDRGISYEAKGQHDRAIQDFDQAIRLNPQNAWTFIDRGISYEAKGQHDRAIQDFDQATRLDPQNALAFKNRGLAKKAKGDTAGGDADIATARQLQPGIVQ